MRRGALLVALAACGGKATPTHAPVGNVVAAAAPKSTCAIEIDRTRTPGVVYPGWLAVFTALDANGGDPIALADGVSAPTDDAGARALMCAGVDEAGSPLDTCAGAGPWIVWVGYPYGDATFALAAPLPGGQLLLFPNQGKGSGAQCPWFDVLDVDPGTPFGVVADREEQMMQEEDGGHEACYRTGDEVDYSYVDLAARAVILSVHAHEGMTVTRTPTGVHVTGGGGCAEDVPFTAR